MGFKFPGLARPLPQWPGESPQPHRMVAKSAWLRRFFCIGRKSAIRPLPCSHLSAKRPARLACSVASALPTAHCRYQLFAGFSLSGNYGIHFISCVYTILILFFPFFPQFFPKAEKSLIGTDGRFLSIYGRLLQKIQISCGFAGVQG